MKKIKLYSLKILYCDNSSYTLRSITQDQQINDDHKVFPVILIQAV